MNDSIAIDLGITIELVALTNPNATSGAVKVAAAKVAAVDDFIMELPNGYNTKVGERGAALSGCQRQRITLVKPLWAGRRFSSRSLAISGIKRLLLLSLSTARISGLGLRI